jgi:oligopeptidase B
LQVQLRGSDKLSFEEAAYTLDLAGHGDFGSPVLLLAYSSLTTPTTWMAHNMATGKRETRKVMPVQGGFSADNYRTERLWAESHDGVKVCWSKQPCG